MRPAVLACTFALVVTACSDPNIPPPPVEQVDGSLDAQLRASFGQWGVVPIGAMPEQAPALVKLGQMLVFDKILSGNRDISCATCHLPSQHGTDRLPIAIGTGGTGLGESRIPGAGRRFVPRNAPSLLDQGLRSQYIFWDGRVSGFQNSSFSTPAKPALPAGITNILAAQAMFPVISREEMRGDRGDLDVFGNLNELAQIADTLHPQIWQAVMDRLRAIPEYVTLFRDAYPGLSTAALGFQHAAAAIAAFEMQAFSKFDSPFDRFLNRDNAAMSPEAMRGGVLFFGQARCASCHGGPLMGGQSFANDGVPQLGPGTGNGAPLDLGRAEVPNQPGLPPSQVTASRFQFRIPPLRNVELTAPYMHNGVYPTLEAVLRHYNDVPNALRTYDVYQVPALFRPLYHGEDATIAAVSQTLDGRLRAPQNFSDEQRAALVAFLKSLTDPAARDLSALVPERVPSGLPVDF